MNKKITPSASQGRPHNAGSVGGCRLRATIQGGHRPYQTPRHDYMSLFVKTQVPLSKTLSVLAFFPRLIEFLDLCTCVFSFSSHRRLADRMGDSDASQNK